MKKISLTIAALALLISASAVLAADLTNPAKTVIPRDTVCINQKVAARESAIMNAYRQMSTGILNALNNRATELTTAWNITDAKTRKKAITQAWNKYTTARKNMVKTYRQQVSAAWKTSREQLKTCKINGQAANVQAEEPNGEKGDTSLE